MAGEVRKMDVRLQGKREENSDDNDGDGDGDGENTHTDFNKPPPPPQDDDDDALLLARASSSSDKNLRMGSIIREQRQSLITDEQLPTKAKIPLAAQPAERRLSVPLELLTKEWPQLTIQHNNLLSRPESVYIPTTTTTSNDCMGISRGNNSLEKDQAASSSFPVPLHHHHPHHHHHQHPHHQHPHHHHENSSPSSSSSFSSSSNNNNNYSLYSQTGDSRLDPFGFSSHLISLPLPTPPPPPPSPADFEYGDLIGQVRDQGESVKARARARAARARRVKKGKERQSDDDKEEEGIIIQPIPNPFSPPRLHRVVRLTNKEHERLQKRISRQWLVCLSILVLPCAPWLLLLFGYGLMDEPVVDYWLTEGDLGAGAGFGKMEKEIAIWLAFLVMALWIGVGVFCWFLH